MARGLNRIQLIGRLGRDPEMRYTGQGKAVTTFSLATGGKWTDRDGNERDDTEWFRVETWERLAEIANDYLKKGSQVYIEGRFRTRKYIDRDGNERLSVEVVTSELILLSSKGDTGGGSDGYRSGGAEAPDGDENDPAAPYQSQPSGLDMDATDLPF